MTVIILADIMDCVKYGDTVLTLYLLNSSSFFSYEKEGVNEYNIPHTFRIRWHRHCKYITHPSMSINITNDAICVTLIRDKHL